MGVEVRQLRVRGLLLRGHDQDKCIECADSLQKKLQKSSYANRPRPRRLNEVLSNDRTPRMALNNPADPPVDYFGDLRFLSGRSGGIGEPDHEPDHEVEILSEASTMSPLLQSSDWHGWCRPRI
jgi:hypothetical protein